MATNYDKITIVQPETRPVLTVVEQSKTLTVAAVPPLRVSTAFDVKMDEATDGSVLVWNGGSQYFEAKNKLRHQSVDGGNF